MVSQQKTHISAMQILLTVQRNVPYTEQEASKTSASGARTERLGHRISHITSKEETNFYAA